jgi:predicted Zn-ribbon and HTH transcriptional regulator
MDKYIMFVDTKTKLERASHCQKCEWYYRPARQCRQCGCFINFKIALTNSSCPIGKWTEFTTIKNDPLVNTPE